MFVLIPAFEPSDRLPRLVDALLELDPDLDVLVVDDGSGARYTPVFDRVRLMGAAVLTHPRNRGKGAALKTGLAFIGQEHPGDDVVTADSDGQHTPADILLIADALRAGAADELSELVLGVRSFAGGSHPVPWRSRVGNALSRALFRVAAGWSVTDTQTGLRGIPADLIAWALSIPGERFEYEQRMLLRARPDGVAAREVPIATVYLDGNASSHFRPLADSARVLLPVLLFAASSIAEFAVDTVAMLVLNALTGSLVVSIIAARLLSASANFAINRRLVFRSGGGIRARAVRYAVLAAALLASNIAWMSFLTDAGVPLLAAKAITEGVLFVLSYGVQRTLVFPPPAAAVGRRTKASHSVRRGSAIAAQGPHLEASGRIETTPSTTGRNR